MSNKVLQQERSHHANQNLRTSKNHSRIASRVLGGAAKERQLKKLEVLANRNLAPMQLQKQVGIYKTNAFFGANFRSNDKDHKVISSLKRGTEVEVINKNGRSSHFSTGITEGTEHSWVRYNGKTGWIKDSNLTFVRQAPAPVMDPVVVEHVDNAEKQMGPQQSDAPSIQHEEQEQKEQAVEQDAQLPQIHYLGDLIVDTPKYGVQRHLERLHELALAKGPRDAALNGDEKEQIIAKATLAVQTAIKGDYGKVLGPAATALQDTEQYVRLAVQAGYKIEAKELIGEMKWLMLSIATVGFENADTTGTLTGTREKSKFGRHMNYDTFKKRR